MARYIYKVYGSTFTNKKEALKYHHKIYGATNYQASTIFDTKTKTVKLFSKLPNKFIFKVKNI